TQTMAISIAGAAFNAGNNTDAAGLSTDQRGQPRISLGIVDLGAFEIQVASFPLVVHSAPDVTPPGDILSNATLTLREAVLIADAEGGSQNISFASGLSNIPLSLVGDTSAGPSALAITSGTNVTIQGLTTSPGITIAAGVTGLRAFDVQ